MLRRRMNRMMQDVFGPWALPEKEILTRAEWTPFCDIYETDHEIVVKAELPEVKKENINVNLEGRTLEITGERKFGKEINKENFHRIERGYGQFLRTFELPTTVDLNKITAEFKEGILFVTLPKTEAAKPKQIEVKVK